MSKPKPDPNKKPIPSGFGDLSTEGKEVDHKDLQAQYDKESEEAAKAMKEAE